jgi:hypothetical protein
MSDFVSIAIIILAAIVHASLQLGLGCLLLLYHESAGKHIKSKTRNIVGSFISGVGSITFLLLATACFVVANTFGGALSTAILIVVISTLIALAVAMWFLYFRRGTTTELWLPKVVARFIHGRAKVTDNNTEAFSLGVMTSFAEIPFLVILLLIAGNSVLELEPMYQPLLVAFYTIITITPLIILNIFIRTGQTVVDIQKWRVKNKLFLRVISGFGFAILGIFIFAFKILGVS